RRAPGWRARATSRARPRRPAGAAHAHKALSVSSATSPPQTCRFVMAGLSRPSRLMRCRALLSEIAGTSPAMRRGDSHQLVVTGQVIIAIGERLALTAAMANLQILLDRRERMLL